MNMLFIGGGSLRILPILRGVFEQVPKVFREGEIRLVDLQLERAEAVGRMLLSCPDRQCAPVPAQWKTVLYEPCEMPFFIRLDLLPMMIRKQKNNPFSGKK